MLAKRIIPCLDVREGKVVKGVNFVGIKEVGDPVECAKEYNQQGADEVVFLDITATHEGRGTMLDVVRRTAKEVFIPLTVGGGINSIEDFRNTLLAGADKAGMVRCTQEEIASSISASRVTVSRTLNQLARDGLVELQYRGVLVRDRPGLERLCAP